MCFFIPVSDMPKGLGELAALIALPAPFNNSQAGEGRRGLRKRGEQLAGY